ncbi:Meiotic expression up-regulated protein 26 [Pseudocercospora fuligena]|uniref:Meiotic expression up-regulated protein 26 n=1 Tax=Pseudocercospora fuligena TaxID=685502 RepID=A0A8H6RHR3_9PEZI|nr:Meiotic expression up-regulated protein 26 [Pseudocercospora fuligena]
MSYFSSTFETFEHWQAWASSQGFSTNNEYSRLSLDSSMSGHVSEDFVNFSRPMSTAVPSGHNANTFGYDQEPICYSNPNYGGPASHISRHSTSSSGYSSSDNHGYDVPCSYPSQSVSEIDAKFSPRSPQDTSSAGNPSQVTWARFVGDSNGNSNSYPHCASDASVSNAAFSSSAMATGSDFDFSSLGSDPPMSTSQGEQRPRRQSPRFSGDRYTARWVRGEGIDRAGWCGVCSSWHKLKDSAYWYHMHYSHGISCATGKPFNDPDDWRHAHGAVGYEALCGGCSQWVYVGRSERWHTPYYRHAYKCLMRNKPSIDRSRSIGKSTSPRKSQVKHLRSL